MYIRETFATKIEERIEPVVKVANRKPAIVFNELANLVVTPQWEKYLHRMLEEYTDAFDSEDEREMGIWISGFFGSGKSLLMKVLGILLRGGEVEGQDIHQLFLNRLPAHSQERADIERFLTICQHKISTSLVGGNLHAIMATGNDPLALIAFKFFADERGYTQNWAFAWAIEYQIDNRGRTEQFRQRVSELSGTRWERVVRDADIYGEDLNKAAAEALPEYFSGPDAVQQAVTQTFHSGIEPRTLIERLLRWCENQDSGGSKHKLLLQLDELGQWLQSGDNTTRRAMEIQALVETASSMGQGRIWIAVTAHGDVQALKENIQQEVYAKINQRFDIQCKLSNEDIDKVVRERLLRKTLEAGSFLRDRFKERRGEITDLGSLQQTRRVYRVPTEENFADFYPYLPWMIDAYSAEFQWKGPQALAPGGKWRIAVPSGAECFRSYGGLGYFHGGASLQEWIVPCLKIEWPDSARPVEVRVQPLAQILSQRPKITLEVQRASLFSDDNALPREIEIIVRDQQHREIFKSARVSVTPNQNQISVILEPIENAEAARNTPMLIELRDAHTRIVFDTQTTILMVEIENW